MLRRSTIPLRPLVARHARATPTLLVPAFHLNRLSAAAPLRASTSSTRSYATTPPPTTIAAEPKGTKIQTIPFSLSPSRATTICETAAHSAYGLSSVFRLLLSRFLSFFGVDLGLASGIERIAFKAVLLPVWKCDLAMKGVGLLEEVEMNLLLSTTDATVSGLKHTPLDQLIFGGDWDSLPVTYDPKEHGKAFEMDVATLPFSQAPLNLLAKIAALPRTNVGKHGIGLNPAQFKPILYAAYPLYLPIYLAEYEWEGKRVTTVAFAGADRTAFAVFPTYQESEAIWLPPSQGVELSISGSPSDPSSLPPSNALQTLKPRLDELLSTSVGQTGKTLSIVDPTSLEMLEGSKRVMRYSEFANGNREFITANEKLAAAEAMFKQVENLDPNVRGLVIGSQGPKIANREALLADAQKKLSKAQKLVAVTKPDWLIEVEEAQKEMMRKGAGRGRG